MSTDLSETERCVKCGLCLPHCPTFQLTGNEADSPRGRISLMQLLDQADTKPSPGLFRHLDQCLQCQACEAMCPSNVPFSALMDTARAKLEPLRQRNLRQRLGRRAGFALVATGTGRSLARLMLGAYRLTRLDRMLNRLPGLPGELRRRLAILPQRRTPPAAATGGDGQLGNLNLFTGCTGALFDQTTLEATRSLLNRIGYRVNIQSAQTCCGALHQHNGEPGQAGRLARKNMSAFAGNDDPVISFASGCAAHLKNYPALYTDAESFGQRVTDIMHFLASRETPLELGAFKQKVALLMPCTHRNVLGQQASVMQVLNRIPGVEVELLNPQGGCCGAAGSYMLTQPGLSGRLGEAMAERFNRSGADILLTTNIGCALQLRAATQASGSFPEIMHPVTLLARLLVD